MSDQTFEFEESFVDYILSPVAIRERAARLYKRAQEGATHFAIHEDKLDEVANYVKDVIRQSQNHCKSVWGRSLDGHLKTVEIYIVVSNISRKHCNIF